MRNISVWIKNVQDLVGRLKGLDFGYPLGINDIFPPQGANVIDKGLKDAGAWDFDELRTFYGNCDGISLPDVHVGYFIKSITKLCVMDTSSEPVKITGEFAGDVVSFGSTGGGGLFVLSKVSGDVLHLAPGPLDNGIYDGNRGRVKQISGSFFEFLERLNADIQAFVENDAGHRFIC
jgi:hypothetical protein